MALHTDRSKQLAQAWPAVNERNALSVRKKHVRTYKRFVKKATLAEHVHDNIILILFLC